MSSKVVRVFPTDIQCILNQFKNYSKSHIPPVTCSVLQAIE